MPDREKHSIDNWAVQGPVQPHTQDIALRKENIPLPKENTLSMMNVYMIIVNCRGVDKVLK